MKGTNLELDRKSQIFDEKSNRYQFLAFSFGGKVHSPPENNALTAAYQFLLTIGCIQNL